MSRKNFEALCRTNAISVSKGNFCELAALDMISPYIKVPKEMYHEYDRIVTEGAGRSTPTQDEISLMNRVYYRLGVSPSDVCVYAIERDQYEIFKQILGDAGKNKERVTITIEYRHAVGIKPARKLYRNAYENWHMYGTWGPFVRLGQQFTRRELFDRLYFAKDYCNVLVLPR